MAILNSFLYFSRIERIERIELSATHYRRSPLFQGGLEIPCVVTIAMPASIKGHLLVQRYEEMVLRLYCEPKEEIIMGKFIQSIDVGIVEQQQVQPVKKKKKTAVPAVPASKDIRSFFNKRGSSANKNNRQSRANEAIIID